MVWEKGFYFNEQMLAMIHENFMSKEKPKPVFENPNKLSKREIEILDLICRQYTAPEIAEKLFISIRTVEGHRNNILEKTGVRNTAGLVVYALANGIVDVTEFRVTERLKS